MKLMELLDEMDIEEVKKLALELGGISIFKDTVKVYLEKKIFEKLTNLHFLVVTIEKMDESCIITLTQLVFFDDCKNKNHLEPLRKKGLVFRDMQVPDEIKELAREYLQSKIRKTFSKQLEVKQTPFLNLILLVGLIKRNEIAIKRLKNNKLNIKLKVENKNVYYHLEKELIPLLISFLEFQGLVYWEENSLLADRAALIKWINNDNFTKLELLYNWLKPGHEKLFKLISILSQIQDDLESWIDLKVFVESDIPHTVEAIEKFNLIRFLKMNKRGYVKLTPEGWFYIKGIYPSHWYSKSILISADFEVYIPHDFDPNLISLLDKYGQLKDNDYFLVYDIDPINLNRNQDRKNYKSFINELEDKSSAMPQVVSYELNNFYNSLS
ncbi:hypothetical protein F9B85_03570 [Heliorestis acidaminivorans]|uniref:Uncharacterized protein n=1 Tax=Heliorestis acidaminivorans TaxID=553427 RepID=A0A6I0F2C5_9FIRM|nr:hypothetical protein [Heliorestis acidaminivorans]KAB2953710.1 hypothetical protein F9B85_03570 [Heliorestis acidaminivorans]